MNVDLPSVGARLWVRISQPPAATNTTTKKWVLLLHGWPDTGELWAPQTAALTQAGYSVIAPDLPGFGQSAFTTNDSPLDPRHYTLRNVVTVLTALLDQLGVGRLHVLVGHDWGAALAWTFAASHPSRLERLVVLSVGHPGALVAGVCGSGGRGHTVGVLAARASTSMRLSAVGLLVVADTLFHRCAGGGAAADPRQRAKWWYQVSQQQFQLNAISCGQLQHVAGCQAVSGGLFD